MATQLAPLSISAPGFYGLNSQEASVDLPINWSLEATNCVIDKYGRIASRKGWSYVTTSTPTSANIKVIFEYITKTGTSTILSCANNKIFSGTTTLVDLSAPGTITADNWQIANFNNKAYFFQKDHVPLEYDGSTIGYATRAHTAWVALTAYSVDQIRRPVTATPYYYVCTTQGTSGATEPTWSTTIGGTTSDGTVIWTTYEIPKADAVSGSLGRLWIGGLSSDKTVVYYSDTLIGHDFYSGASGSIDLKTVWTDGMDEITAITTFNGLLIIFAKKSILLYNGSYDPNTMAITEHIKGVGCIARNSIQDIGNDLLFLSDKGIMSLGRLIQQNGSIPLDDVSANVRDELLNFVANETMDNIKSTYSDKEGFYLISFPTSSYVYCFDVRSKLEDGTFKVTTWDSITPYALLTTRSKNTYLGKAGKIALYSTYLDGTNTYNMRYRSTWQHLDNGVQVKMPKSLECVIIGGFNSALILQMAFDYSITDNVFTKTIPNNSIAEYGISEYGIAEYTGSGSISTLKYQLTGSGKTFNFGIQNTVNGVGISIQKIDILTKLGRIM